MATVEWDNEGKKVVTHADLPPHHPQSSVSTSHPSPEKPTPSSPRPLHRSSNFYDLTKSSPDISPVNSPKTSPREYEPSGARALKERDRDNIVPELFAKPVKPTKDRDNDRPLKIRERAFHSSTSLIIASLFIDPAALLPPNSSLWKSSKVDVRKPSYKLDSTRVPTHTPSSDWNPHSQLPLSSKSPQPQFSSNGVRHPSSMTKANATPFDIPSNAPRPPPYLPHTSFIHPDTLARHYHEAPAMTPENEQEALKNLFEAALEPEKPDSQPENEDHTGKVEGLHVTLMTHQISGLEFLCNHESTVDKKGKGKYGGILADDVLSPPLR